MRALSPALLAAQQSPSHIPYVRVTAGNRIGGLVRLDWQRLYAGVEDDYFHALAIPADGSLIRARITPPSDGRKLYRQRVASPNPSSDISAWTYAGQYNCVVVAIAASGADVSIFWINTSREIRRIGSPDYGSSWGAPELIDYSPTAAITGLAAACKPNGDLALFFADQATLYVKKCVGGSWQPKSAWDKTTGDLSGVSAVYDAGWDLLVTGKDAGGNFMLWSLIFGDGGEVVAGNWSALSQMASAPAAAGFEYLRPFLDKPDVFRCFFIEKYSGSLAYNRPFWSHAVPGTTFLDSLWREPVPFDLASDYGLAMAHHGDYCWLCNPGGVWRAASGLQTLDPSADVVAIKQELGQDSGKLVVELRNDRGQYAAPGQGSLAALDIGAQLDFAPGYVTSAGGEVSAGQSFTVESYEHTSSGGRASLVLYAYDGWAALESWKARHQFRWNKSSADMSVKDMLSFILARAGINLVVISASALVSGYYPDFTINVNENGLRLIRNLLSLVPDLLFIEGNQAYLIDPSGSDPSVYGYGTDHPILEGRYGLGGLAANWAQVEGSDPATGSPIVSNTFNWTEIEALNDRIVQIEDPNLASTGDAEARGAAILRKAEIQSGSGSIRVPVNCGQQLYDVIEITDVRAGLSAEKRRVLGLSLSYSPARGEYQQRISLGEV